MRNLIPLFLLTLIACSAEPPSTIVDPARLAERIESANAPLILDVRTPAEYAAGHVPGAINIPHDQLASRHAELDVEPGEEVIVYCHSGRRAGKAIDTLESTGYEGVRHLDGDWQAWQAAGRPHE